MSSNDTLYDSAAAVETVVEMVTAEEPCVAAVSSDYTEILEGVRVSVSLGEDESKYFSFVPEYTHAYTFYSTGADDSYGYILDSSETLLASNDDGGTDYNFSVSYTMQANVQYILRAKNIEEGSDSFSVYVTANHDGERTVVTPATCLAEGLQTYVCDACGQTFDEIIPVIAHSYVNGICQGCGNPHQSIASGSCGTSITWTMYDSGLLEMSGSGDMTNWSSSSSVPWVDYRDQIITLTLSNGITSIGGYAWTGCANLDSVTMPDSITHIYDGAFNGCIGLKSITLPASLEYIGQSAFNGTGLTSVTIPGTVSNIGNYAFGRCPDLQRITVSTSNTVYKSQNGVLFSADMTKLYQYPVGKASVYNSKTGVYAIPEGVTEISAGAFIACADLTQIIFPESLLYIGPSAFSDCTGLTALELPSKLWKIDEWAFSSCELDYVKFYPTLSYFVSYAFSNATIGAVYYGGTAAQWANITFETSSYATANNVLKNNSNIYYQAFGSCGENLEYNIFDGVLTISGTGPMPDCASNTASDLSAELPWYCNKSKLTGIVIEDGVTTIGDYAFYECNYLASVSIGKDVKVIGKDAFHYCNLGGLSSIPLPAGLTTIRDNAFWGCTKLTSMTIPASVTSIGNSAFKYCDRLSTIRFLGSFPNMAADGEQFYNLPALQVYYPANNETWSEDVRLKYGSKQAVTWVPDCQGRYTAVTDPAVAPSCNETGLAEESHCSVCGEILVAQEVVPAAHTPVTMEAVAPTCTQSGLTEGTLCDLCGEILTPQEVVPAAHTVVTDAAVAPTCFNPGLTEGSHCSACGEVFTAQQEIPATGHEFTDNTCTVCGAATGSCGTGLTWLLEDGVLTISGSGATDSYSLGGAPWYGNRARVTSLVIAPDVTGIGNYAFAYCTNLKTITFQGDEISIANNAFYKVTAEVIYKGSWSSTAMQNYGGTLTWTGPCGGNHTVVTESAVAATCTETGLTEGSHCDLCGMVLQEQTVVDALGHNMGSWETTTAATCTASGQEIRSCIRCDHYETRTTAATGHDYESTVTVPGCESQGFTSHLCLNCGDSYTNGYTSPLGHDLSIRTTIQAATCTENGQEKQQCSRCSHSELAVLEATGHNYQSVVTAPGCETTGYTTHTCLSCGDSYKNTYTSALGHDLGAWETVIAATCTSSGSQRRTCSRCDHYETQSIAAPGHSVQTLSAVASTCTASGLTEGKGCSSCGLVTEAQETIPALGHDMSSWTISAAATCTKEGVRRRDCTRCDHYETQSIAATGHTERTLAALEATCTDSGLTEGTDCATCGAVLTAQQTIAALGHNYSSWTTVTAATCTASGQQRRDCSRCSHYETKIIQATGHKEQIIPGVSATCTDSGLTEGIVCSVCDTVLTAQKAIAAKGHTEQILPAVEATCTESGLTEGKICTVCDAVLIAQQTVKAPGHTEQILSAVEAACTQSGLTEGKQCSVCQQILLAQEVVSATGHDYVNYVCQNCGGYASDSGNLGQDVTWEVDTQAGQLIFDGSGALVDPELVPWAGYEDVITEIVIGDGVTEVGSGIFEELDNLEAVTIPDSVITIAPDAFTGCENLTDILVSDSNPNYADQDGILFNRDGTELIQYPAGREEPEYSVPETVETICNNAFSGNTGLETILFTGNMPEFEDNAFAGLEATVYYPGEDTTWEKDKLLNYDGNITWIPQYSQPEVMSIIADCQVLCLGDQAVLTAQLNRQESAQILWEITEGSDCVQFSANGTTALLTAKAVTARTTVTVTARTADGVAPAAQICIDVLPQVQSLSVYGEDGADATDKAIWWDLNSGVTEMTFTAAAHPADASGDVTWTFSDPSRLYAEYTASGNALTISSPTGKTGMVYITVTAADGSGQSAKFAVKFTALRTETDAPESEDPADIRLLSGKTRNLTVYDTETGKPLTSKQIIWSMDEVYAPYAKLDAKGKLTAKKVVEKVRVEAIGTIIGSEGTTVTVTADIYPAATSLELLREDTLVNNQTISLDHRAEPLVLTAGIHPLDAMQDVTWTISDKKEAFASYEIDGSILTVTPKVGAKPGTVTIKVTSNDGSKKTATAKLQFASYAQTVTIDKSITELTVGDKAIQLNAAMEPEVVTKSGIVWSLKNAAGKNYVNLASGGKIAPKNVLAPVDVVIVATSKDGMASDEHTITIRPKSERQLVIKAGDAYVTKTTQTLDVNIRESITLSAHTYGQEGLTMVEWSPLTAKGADITPNTNGTLTVRMTSPGNINITAKAEDGRKATVAIKGVKLASAVEISQKKTGITEGLELASGKSLDLQATLTNAASKKVTWSITEGSAFATLTSSGKLTAAKDLTAAQTVVVRATAEGGAYDELEIILRPAARGVQLYSEAGGRMLFSFRSQDWWVRSNTTLVWDSATQSDTISLNARVYPYYGGDDQKNAAQAVSWQSSSPKVAQIKVDAEGNVQLICKGIGKTTITATAADGSKEKVSFQLTVVKSITSLTLEDQALSCGKKLDLSKLVTITPLDATSKKLTWQLLEGAEYASLSKAGVLTAKKDAAGGKVRVRVTPAENAVEGVYAECTVSIFAAATRVAIFDGDYDATGQQGNITIKSGEDTALCFLRAVVYPYTDDGNDTNDASQKVIWKSSNTAYAEVEDGQVILKRAGIGKTVTITATAADGSGKKASVKIRIDAE